MRLRLAGILTCVLLAAAGVQAGEDVVLDSDADGLGFWDVGPSRFSADEPVVVKSPVAQEGNQYYYVWPFRFKHTLSLERVVDLLEDRVAKAQTANKRRTLELMLETAKEDLARGERRLRLHISLHTDTGEVYHDLANPVIRNLAEKKTGGRYYTTQELRTAEVGEDALVECMAIFPEIDVDADRFEIRVLGLGRRVLPNYFPGHILKSGVRADAKLRRAIRYFYERLGDPLNRQIDRIREIDARCEWLWLWSTDVYPLQSEAFVVKRSQGLQYEYRFFPYEVYNSTAEDRKLEVRKAGLAPRVRWHGVGLTLAMVEDVAEHDFWQKQAVKTLRETRGDVFPAEGQHVAGEVPAGKIRKGVAIIRWGVSDPEALLREVAAKLRVMGLTAGTADAGNPLVQAYIDAADLGGEAKWRRRPLPSEEEVREIILDQARKEIEQRAGAVTDADVRRYGDLAPFAVLMNLIAAEEIERQQGTGRVPVTFTVATADIVDTARFDRLYAAGRPVEREESLTAVITDPETIEGAAGLGPAGPTGPTERPETGPAETPGTGPGAGWGEGETTEEGGGEEEVIEDLW